MTSFELPPPSSYRGSSRAMNSSPFLSGDDLLAAGVPRGQEVHVVIADVLRRENVRSQYRDELQTLWTLKLAGKNKELRINSETRLTLESLYGQETEEWIGKTIAMIVMQRQVGDKVREVIVVRPPKKQLHVAAAAPVAPPPKTVDVGSDDEIPFSFLLSPFLATAATLATSGVALLA